MCTTNQGGGPNISQITRFDIASLESLQKKAGEHFRERVTDVNARVFAIKAGGTPALAIISGKSTEKRAFFVFQKLGTFGGLELELRKFDISYPKADVVLWFKFDPLQNDVFKVEGTITIHCDDVAHPTGCNVSLDFGKTAKEIRPLINWDCLKNCAPQCIECGSDWECWAQCAGVCIIQCL